MTLPTNNEIETNPAITYLKSTSHVRVLEHRGNWLRSALVGIQFGIILFPFEVVTVALGPFFINLFTSIFTLFQSITLITIASFEALRMGLLGRLEATEHPNEVLEGLEDEAVQEAHGESFEAWWSKYGEELSLRAESHEEFALNVWLNARNR